VKVNRCNEQNCPVWASKMCDMRCEAESSTTPTAPTFDQAAGAERVRALALHPPEEWAGMTKKDMWGELNNELWELWEAIRGDDTTSEHSIYVEAVHVAGVARRIFEEIQRRETADKAGEKG
jgi:hypothetical protein